jgi:hypothetical protein
MLLPTERNTSKTFFASCFVNIFYIFYSKAKFRGM